MEDGLREGENMTTNILPILCLNPCSCGRWSQRPSAITLSQRHHIVLILVLVEDGLRAHPNMKVTSVLNVLILVLVEDGLRDISSSFILNRVYSLNPCSCGRWSQSVFTWHVEVTASQS